MVIAGYWTLADIAEWEGQGRSTEAVRQALRRLGVDPVPDLHGRGGARLYDPEKVRAEWPRLPGRGARTDLTRGAGDDDDGAPPT